MTLAELVGFVRANPLGVEASVSARGPQAAVVGFGVADDGTLVFDTSRRSRKFANLVADGRIALVFTAGEATLQVEGVATLTTSASDLATYFAAFPDGRGRAADPDICHFAVKPTWARLSDYAVGRIEELDLRS